MTDHADTSPQVGDAEPIAPRGPIDRILFEILRWGSIATLLFMTVLIGMDALLRTFAGLAFFGTHDLVGLSLILLFLVALPHSWSGNYHVRMDMIYQTYGRVGRYAADLLAGIGALLMGGLIAWQAWLYVPQFMRVGTSSPLLKIPYWPLAAVVCIFATLFCLAVIYNMASRTIRLVRGGA